MAVKKQKIPENPRLEKGDTNEVPGALGSEGSRNFGEFFSVIAKIAGTLVSLAALFVLLGYIIVLSFINDKELYGLASFTQEFYKDAAITFMEDIFLTYGEHPLWLGFMVFLIVTIALGLKSFFDSEKARTLKYLAIATRILVSIFVIVVIILTLRLHDLPKTFMFINKSKVYEFDRVFLFMVSMPILASLFLYLALKFGEFLKNPKDYKYYFVTMLFLGMFVAIPVTYGNTIFDIDVFHVIGFDSSDNTLESLNKLKKEIDTQQSTVFFIMGHATDKVIFLNYENQTSLPKIILLDKSLIKFLKVVQYKFHRKLGGFLGGARENKPLEANTQPLPSDIQSEIWGKR